MEIQAFNGQGKGEACRKEKKNHRFRARGQTWGLGKKKSYFNF